jgi:hypothetical protein
MPSFSYNGAQITAWKLGYDPLTGVGILAMNYVAIRMASDGAITTLPNAAKLGSIILTFMGSAAASALLASAEEMIAAQEGLDLRAGEQVLL